MTRSDWENHSWWSWTWLTRLKDLLTQFPLPLLCTYNHAAFYDPLPLLTTNKISTVLFEPSPNLAKEKRLCLQQHSEMWKKLCCKATSNPYHNLPYHKHHNLLSIAKLVKISLSKQTKVELLVLQFRLGYCLGDVRCWLFRNPSNLCNITLSNTLHTAVYMCVCIR